MVDELEKAPGSGRFLDLGDYRRVAVGGVLSGEVNYGDREGGSCWRNLITNEDQACLIVL